MPAQKRASDNLKVEEEEEEDSQQQLQQQLQHQSKKEEDDDEGGGGDEGDDSDGSASHSGGKDDEFIVVKLADIRKEVQCPICLGIIRKTRTVMECLHRFCRECIDKSMRLGNNECPACRTHCASRRSLRDDPNYDALIAALYPDIDKYEEEELAFHEEEKTRNKQIQASIAQTLRRQSEALALGRRRPAPKQPTTFRRSNRTFRFRGRNRHTQDTGLAGSEDEEDDANGNEGGKDSFSADERCTDIRPKRCKRQRLAAALTSSSNMDGGCDEIDDTEAGRDSRGASPARAGTPEVLVWGKGGTRSHTRYGSISSSNGKNARNSRLSKLIDYLRNLEDNDDEGPNTGALICSGCKGMSHHILDGELITILHPQVVCRQTFYSKTMGISLLQFIALQIAVQAEELEILVKEQFPNSSAHHKSTIDASSSTDNLVPKMQVDPCKEEELQILDAQETLAGLHASCSSRRGNLVRSISKHFSRPTGDSHRALVLARQLDGTSEPCRMWA